MNPSTHTVLVFLYDEIRHSLLYICQDFLNRVDSLILLIRLHLHAYYFELLRGHGRHLRTAAASGTTLINNLLCAAWREDIQGISIWFDNRCSDVMPLDKPWATISENLASAAIIEVVVIRVVGREADNELCALDLWMENTSCACVGPIEAGIEECKCDSLAKGRLQARNSMGSGGKHEMSQMWMQR